MLAYEKKYWKKGLNRIAGIDEAGRGPLAGPVVAAALIFSPGLFRQGIPDTLQHITDSKKLSSAQRHNFYQILKNHPQATIGVGEASSQEIDKLNILKATHLAMKRSVENMLADFLLVDGPYASGLPFPVECIVKGDQKSLSIAAASIIAKVTRDRMMENFSKKYPGYGFEKNRGYPTRAHISTLRENGPCPIHRFTFRHVKT